MYWDHGYGMGLGWIWVVLLVLLVLSAIAALVVLLVKATSAGSSSSAPPAHGPWQGGATRTSARDIAEERLARGELTPEQFREIVRALEEGSGRQGG
jgi:putative membrane protein